MQEEVLPAHGWREQHYIRLPPAATITWLVNFATSSSRSFVGLCPDDGYADCDLKAVGMI
jgi:hypothetical protein